MDLRKCHQAEQDCFMNKDGYCYLLSAAVKHRKCSFYKTEEDIKADDAKSIKRLEEIGRQDLIKKYFGGKR